MKKIKIASFLNFAVISFLVLPACGQVHGEDVEDSYYFKEEKWIEAVGEDNMKNPAYAFVAHNKNLPNILLIGNSISIGYTPTVRQVLSGIANVYRIPVNGGDTYKFLENHDQWLSTVEWDVIHINFGLHDLKRLDENGNMDINFEWNNSPEEYRANLQKVYTILTEDTDAKIIWATTTFVPEGSNGRITGDEVLFNEIAMEVMKEFPGIVVNDLYAASLEIKSLQREANVHYTEEGYMKLGEVVAECINGQLK